MSDDVSNAPIFATPPVTKGREFEFGAAENEVFKGLAVAMRFVSVGSIALAVLLLLSALALSGFGGVRMLPFAIGQSIAAAVMIITGVWLRGASRSVDAIVTTQGSDVSHLMSAMAHLGRMFALQRVVFMAAFAVGALGFVGSVGMMAFFR